VRGYGKGDGKRLPSPYRFWPGDSGRVRAWYIDVDKDLFQTELNYLFAEVFKRKVDLPTEPVNCFKRFSDRV